jgi:hypothetical protein
MYYYIISLFLNKFIYSDIFIAYVMRIGLRLLISLLNKESGFFGVALLVIFSQGLALHNLNLIVVESCARRVNMCVNRTSAMQLA